MAINALGGETGQGIRTTVSLLSTFAATVARGDFCQWHTANWTVNSAADGTNLEHLGRIIKLAPDSGTATVEWFALHGPYAFTYSTVGVLGSSLDTAGAGTSTVAGTSNATLGLSTNRVVAVDTANTKVYAVFR